MASFEKIVRGSCWNHPQKVLALGSCRCSALVLVWNFFWGVHRKFLYEDLARSFFDDLCASRGDPTMRFWYEVLMSRHSIASCAKTDSSCCSSSNVQPDLLLLHGYCCLFLVHWLLTTHAVWGLLPEYPEVCSRNWPSICFASKTLHTGHQLLNLWQRQVPHSCSDSKVLPGFEPFVLPIDSTWQYLEILFKMEQMAWNCFEIGGFVMLQAALSPRYCLWFAVKNILGSILTAVTNYQYQTR